MTVSAQQKMQALNDMKRFAAMFPGFVAVLGDISEIGSTEQALAESKAVLEKFRTGLKGQQIQADAAIQRKHEDADREIEVKRRDAETEARGIIQAANDEVAPLRAEILQLRADVAATSLKLGGLDDAISAKTAELDEVGRNLAATRARHQTAANELGALKARLGL
jgi:chromosome segregation ATPase